jgi:uncharacterized membrane protein
MKQVKHSSPILDAIHEAETKTTGEIRVHLSRRVFERNTFGRANRLFHQYSMAGTLHRNAILIYVNLRRKKFAIVGDEGAHQAVGQRYWDEVARELKKNFMSTHPENAIALTVTKLGERLMKHFPREVQK